MTCNCMHQYLCAGYKSQSLVINPLSYPYLPFSIRAHLPFPTPVSPSLSGPISPSLPLSPLLYPGPSSVSYPCLPFPIRAPLPLVLLQKALRMFSWEPMILARHARVGAPVSQTNGRHRCWTDRDHLDSRSGHGVGRLVGILILTSCPDRTQDSDKLCRKQIFIFINLSQVKSTKPITTLT